MNIEELQNKLKENKRIVLVDGVTGIGKTYTIKEYLKKKNPIYISLYGIKSLEELERNFLLELSSKNDKLSKICKYYENLSITSEIIQKEINEANPYELNVVVDDLEKKSTNITYQDIFGFIYTIEKIQNIKIIIISNTKQIKEVEEFHKCSEIIEEVYKIKQYCEEAIHNIINSNKINIEEVITEEKFNNYLTNFLEQYKIKNLRTIKKMIDFSKTVLNSIERKDLSKADINTITNICFATTIEKRKDLLKDNEPIIKEIVSNYMADITYPVSREELVSYIISIYDQENIETNYLKINLFFKQVKECSEEKKEKDLFYCSYEKIEKRIKKFMKTSILKYNNTLSISLWYNKLYDYYFYADLIGKKELLVEEDIIKIMDSYIENIKCEEISLFNLILKMQHEGNVTDDALNTYRILKDKIVYKYFMYHYERNLNSYELGIYDKKRIANLITFILGTEFKNMNDLEEVLSILRNKKLFIPNLDGEIDTTTWEYVQEIWKGITSSDDSQNKRKLLNLLIQISNDMYQTATKIGKHRITILNEYYNILQIQ